MKLATKSEGTVSAMPVGPIVVANIPATQTVPMEPASPAPAEIYAAAYSPHTPLRTISEKPGYQAQVTITEDVLPQGVPELPKKNDIPMYVALGVAAVIAFNFLKRG